MSKEEGQPGTPEKPLSDLGRVSYHAYWKSVVLEHLNKHRDGKLKLTDISKESGMYCHDVATALQLLGFVRQETTDKGEQSVLSIDWKKVDAHAERVKNSKTRIYIDPECLRWTPLLTNAVNPFRDDKSDTEKDSSIQETADIIVPQPEKIILETPGVKLKRGKKRKISYVPKTPKTPKAESKTPTPAAAASEKLPEEEIELTSSGRKRTRPMKYNETTYADVKKDNKRRRHDSTEKDSEEIKKKPKIDIPSKTPKRNTINSAATSVDTPKTPQEDDLSVGRKRRCTIPLKEKVVGERWSQRRAKKLELEEKSKTETEKTEEEEEDSVQIPPKLEEIIKEVEVDKPEKEETIPVLTPQVKKVVRKMKKKRGWVKGRPRNVVNVSKQLTLPEMMRAKLQKESESESLISEKSDEEVREAKADSENRVPTTPEKLETVRSKPPKEKRKSTPRISTEEDSSAEADDEMEKDELPPKESLSPATKYKLNKLSPTKDKELRSPVKKESPSVTKEEKTEENAAETKVKTKSPLYSTTSESETEIDGQKIKTISHKDIMLDIVKQSPTKTAAIVHETKEEIQTPPVPIKNEEQSEKIEENIVQNAKEDETMDDAMDIDKVESVEPEVPVESLENSSQQPVDMEIDIEPSKEASPEKPLVEEVAKPEEKPKDVQITETSPPVVVIEDDTPTPPSQPQPIQQPEPQVPSSHQLQDAAQQPQTMQQPQQPQISPQPQEHHAPQQLQQPQAPQQLPPPLSQPQQIQIPHQIQPTNQHQTHVPHHVQQPQVTQNQTPQQNQAQINQQPAIPQFSQPALPPHMHVSQSQKQHSVPQQPSVPHHVPPINKIEERQLSIDEKKIQEDREKRRTETPKVDVMPKQKNEPSYYNSAMHHPQHTAFIQPELHQSVAPVMGSCTTHSTPQVNPVLSQPFMPMSIPSVPTSSHVEYHQHKEAQSHIPKPEKPQERTQPQQKPVEKESREMKETYQHHHSHQDHRQQIEQQKYQSSSGKPREESQKSRQETAHKSKREEEKRHHSKSTHEDKSAYDKTKMQLEQENLLATQYAQFNQWQWERLAWEKGYPITGYQGYPMSLQFPHLDMLQTAAPPNPKQQTSEKDKSKSHRHESKHSQQSSSGGTSGRTKEKERDKQYPRKDDKKRLEQEHTRHHTDQRIDHANTAISQQPKGMSSADKTKGKSEREDKNDVGDSHSSSKHAPPTPNAQDIPSMGVYTPDSTTNSVHSLHYGQCDLDVAQLNLESPASISSDMASQNSVEPIRPPSEMAVQHQQQHAGHPPHNYDCAVQHNMQQGNMQVQQASIPASSPNVGGGMQMPQQQTSNKRGSVQQQRNR